MKSSVLKSGKLPKSSTEMRLTPMVRVLIPALLFSLSYRVINRDPTSAQIGQRFDDSVKRIRSTMRVPVSSSQTEHVSLAGGESSLRHSDEYDILWALYGGDNRTV